MASGVQQFLGILQRRKQIAFILVLESVQDQVAEGVPADDPVRGVGKAVTENVTLEFARARQGHQRLAQVAERQGTAELVHEAAGGAS